MIDKVKTTIFDYKMLDINKDRILVGLSGGADSICLCLVLKKLGYSIGAVHINHCIREEADKDMQFAENFCKTNDIEFYKKIVNVKEFSADNSISEETAGRIVRYKTFKEVADKYGYNIIAVAHNKNDVAETMLLNLTRGSGVKGLCSIPQVRENIVRPLINITRKEIEDYLKEEKQAFVIDKTNNENDYTRNKIRNLIIPILEEINPSVLDSVERTAKILSNDYEYINSVAEKYVVKENECAVINKNDFINLHSAVKARCILLAYEYVAKSGKDIEYKHIEYISSNISEDTHKTIINLPHDVICKAEYEKIIFQKKQVVQNFEYSLNENEQLFIKEVNLTLKTSLISKNEVVFTKGREYFDFEKLKLPLTVRNFNEGDKFVPLGMQGHQKLKNLFVNLKIPESDRKKQLLVLSGDDIINIHNLRRSDLYKIDNSTEKILMLEEIKYDK